MPAPSDREATGNLDEFLNGLCRSNRCDQRLGGVVGGPFGVVCRNRLLSTAEIVVEGVELGGVAGAALRLELSQKSH